MDDQHTHQRGDDAASLLPALLQALQEQPLRPVLHWQGRSISSGMLLHKSLRLSEQLGAAGIGAHSTVAVLLPRCPDMLVVLLALWLRGAVYVPLDPGWPRARLEAALELGKVQVLLTRPELQEYCARSNCPVLLLAAVDFAAAMPDPAASHSVAQYPALAADDLAYLLFTSGSSGSPKAVCVSHGALAALFTTVLPLLQLQPGWRLLGCSAFCFDIVFFEWLAPILGGCSLVLADDASQRDAAALAHLISTQQVDVVQATPSLWRLLLQQAPLTPGRLQLVIATGEALDARTAQALLALGASVWNLYGPTECTIWSSACCLSDAALRHDSAAPPIGKPLPGYRFTLLPHDETGDDPAAGELLISGAGVAAGYLGAEPAQQARFARDADGLRSFRSGDLCRRDATGNYHWLRRCDSQLKLNGYRVEAGEIEAHLCRHPSIRAAVCLVRERSAGSQLLAFVVCEPGMPNKDMQRWNQHLASWLPQWLLPQRYFVLDAFPLDANGKLDRRALLQLSESGAGAQAACNDALQAEVGRIFCSVLGVDSIGACDSFFDLGGNSMLSATLLLALNQRCGTQLGLRELLRTPPTVRRVTQQLRDAGARLEQPAA